MLAQVTLPPRRARRHVTLELAPTVLGMLLVVDGLVALAYLAHFHVAALADRRWDMSLEGSWGEWYGHALELVVVAGLVLLWRRHHQPLYAAWAALFAYIGVDDTIQIHERVGGLIADDYNSNGFRGQDVGELLSWAVAGAVFFALLWWAHRRSDADARRHGMQLLGGFGLLFLCGVVLDQGDRLLPHAWHQIERMVVMAEDGGELVALSVLVASVVAFLSGPRARRAPADPR